MPESGYHHHRYTPIKIGLRWIMTLLTLRNGITTINLHKSGEYHDGKRKKIFRCNGS